MEELKEVRISPIKLHYPDVMLWRTIIKDKEKIKIINEQDFPREEVLSGLGIYGNLLVNSFGICDPEEIKERISLMRLLIEHREVSEWALNPGIWFLMPEENEEFLKFYDPRKAHNPYWQGVRDFIGLADKYGSDVPSRLKVIVDSLRNSLQLEESEKEMAHVIADRVQNIAVIEGLMTFRLSVSEKICGDMQKKIVLQLSYEESESHIHGHRMYSFALNAAKNHYYPYWTENKWNPANWIGTGHLVRWYIKQLNIFEKKKAYKEMTITNASLGLIADVADGVLKRLEQVEVLKTKVNEDPPLFQFDRSLVRVYFSYSSKGLRIRIYGIDPPVDYEDFHFLFGEYDGYSPDRIKIIEDARVECIMKIHEYFQSIASAQLLNRILEKHPLLFEELFSAPSPLTDKEHRWFALTNLYNSQALKETYDAVRQHREFFSRHIKCLKDVAEVAVKLRDKAEKLQTTICYPEILEDGQSLVDFEEIFPIHLLPHLNGKRPVPIRSLSQLNGNIVGFTGYHGGGKTVTKLSIADNIYLAQSGLPIFGAKFKLNVKKVIGMVFIERGHGSTCELLLKKIKGVLESIQNVNSGEVVLILDELGSATQESSGFELGKDVLNKLSRSKVSVLFSTQITTLAKYAEEGLGAKCFQFDQEHRIKPGIGTGHMEDLRKRIGLDKLLQQ